MTSAIIYFEFNVELILMKFIYFSEYLMDKFVYMQKIGSLLIIGIIGLKFSHIQASDKAGEGAFQQARTP